MRLRIPFLLLLFPLLLTSQNENGLVNWLTFQEAQEKFKTAPRPILIDFYTDWCGWCKHMMRTTYSNPSLAGYINQNFYAVKFNAETKDTIEYQGKIYRPLSPEARTPHELAIKFLGEKLSYPSTVLVTNSYSYNLLVQGYMEDKKLEPLLVFILENAWQTSVFDEFNKHFVHTFYDTVYPKGKLKTYTFPEMLKAHKKKPKPVLVSLSAEFCNTGKVMNATTFSDTSLAAYLDKNFYVVKFDVSSTDTIVFKNEKFHQVLANNFPMHSLAFRLSNNRFTLPAICVLDEQLNTLDVLSSYQSPEHLKPIARYFGDKQYKAKSFADFLRDYQKSGNKP